jgi:Tfp pilus assembly protein PilV
MTGPAHPASAFPSQCCSGGLSTRVTTTSPALRKAALLRDGPMTCRELADRAQEARGLTRRRVRDRVNSALGNMQRTGWVTLTDNLWALTSVNSALTSDGLVNDAATSSSPRQ